MEFDEAKHLALFHALDKDKNGYIDYNEFKSALLKRAFFRRQSEHQLTQIFNGMDLDKSGRISCEEFMIFAQHQHEVFVRTFQEIDQNQDGKLSFVEILNASSKLGLQAQEDQIIKFIRRVSLRPNSVDIEISDFREFFHNLEISMIITFDKFHQPVDFGEDSKHVYAMSSLRDRLAVFLAGGVAGVISRTVTAPADRMKVMIQSGRTGKMGLFQLAQSIYSEGGFRGFFRGNYANVLKIGPETATKFFVFESVQPFVCSNPYNPTIAERFVCGAMAGVASQLMVYPLEITKTRFAIAKTGEHNSIGSVLSQIYKSDGVPGIYRGCGASICGVIPYAGVDLAIYTKLKTIYVERHPNREPTSFTILGFGAASSICGQIVAYPLQVLRTRLQISGLDRLHRQPPARTPKISIRNGALLATSNATSVLSQPRKASAIQIAAHIFETQGLRGFYSGITCNFMKSVPAISLTYLFFERSKQAFRKMLGCDECIERRKGGIGA